MPMSYNLASQTERDTINRFEYAEFQHVKRGVHGHPQGHGGQDPPDELSEDLAAELSEEAGERATHDDTMRNSNTTKPPLKRKRSKKNKAMLMPLPPANIENLRLG